MTVTASAAHCAHMSAALQLARRGYGATSPNPMVGAVLVRGRTILGRGWHRQAGGPHAEIEALEDARRRGFSARGATLYVTLEPCSTHGRTPPCTEAIRAAQLARVVVAATDPNPAHAGRGFGILRRAGIEVIRGILSEEATALNAAFNHWIVRRLPYVTVKAAMTLDGKIATPTGESKWITGPAARAEGMRLRRGADAILVGVNTILADDPGLTWRPAAGRNGQAPPFPSRLRRIILDTEARTPVRARVVSDEQAELTTVVVGRGAPARRMAALRRRVRVLEAPRRDGRIQLPWLLRQLGTEQVTHLLVEGGGEVNASFLLGGLTQGVAFFYAPKVLGGQDALKAVAGRGARSLNETLSLDHVEWRQVGADLMMTARVRPRE